MELFEQKRNDYTRRLLMSRMRVLVTNGFYGLLLMHMKFALDDSCDTASVDGERIYINPRFLDEIRDSELDFILMHEILHVALQHCLRKDNRSDDLYNQACDIVVNSNILLSNNMNRDTITLINYGESDHIAPNGKEGYNYSVEEVYEMLKNDQRGNKDPEDDKAGENRNGKGGCGSQPDEDNHDSKKGEYAQKDYISNWDDHSRWGTGTSGDEKGEVWKKRFEDACEAISNHHSSCSRGKLPKIAERALNSLRRSKKDWRQLLHDFIQEEVVDYSFTPPDKRYDGNDFFLPDYNDTDIAVKDILFMIDTSGSMSDEMITEAYYEVKGAIDQFDGRLQGWLGFFDAEVVEPQPFANEDEFRIIRPKGGGGTDYNVIFEYVRDHMSENIPSSIVIITDGCAPMPSKEEMMRIPVLWIIMADK